MALPCLCEESVRQSCVMKKRFCRYRAYNTTITGFQVLLSMPAIVGKDGIEGTVPISLNSREEEALQHSAETLENIIRENLLST